MATFISLVNLAGNLANDTTFKDGGSNEELCKEFINEIQRRLVRMRDWNFLLKTSALTQFDANVDVYTLDVDCREIFNIIDKDNDYKLIQLPYDEFEAVLPNADDKGTPQYYIIIRPFINTTNRMQIKIYPKPINDINVEVKYFKRIADVTSESYEMTNNIPEDKILAYGAAMLIRQKNDEDASFCREMYESILKDIIRNDEDKFDMVEQFGLGGARVVDPSHPLMWHFEW